MPCEVLSRPLGASALVSDARSTDEAQARKGAREATAQGDSGRIRVRPARLTTRARKTFGLQSERCLSTFR